MKCIFTLISEKNIRKEDGKRIIEARKEEGKEKRSKEEREKKNCKKWGKGRVKERKMNKQKKGKT